MLPGSLGAAASCSGSTMAPAPRIRGPRGPVRARGHRLTTEAATMLVQTLRSISGDATPLGQFSQLLAQSLSDDCSMDTDNCSMVSSMSMVRDSCTMSMGRDNCNMGMRGVAGGALVGRASGSHGVVMLLLGWASAELLRYRAPCRSSWWPRPPRPAPSMRVCMYSTCETTKACALHACMHMYSTCEST